MNQLIGKVEGADFWMILSLIMFGVFFIGVIGRLFFLNRKHAEYLGNIPFTENEINN